MEKKKITMKKILFLLLASLSITLSNGQTAQEIVNLTAQKPTYIDGQGSQLALNQNIILSTAGAGSFDIGTTIGYNHATFAITVAAGTVTAGVITFEQSADNFATHTQAVFVSDINGTGSPFNNYTVAASTNRSFVGNIFFRYIRARISTGITGTTTGVRCFTTLKFVPMVPNQFSVVQGTATNLNANINTLTTLSQFTASAASADATANPTSTGLRAFNFLFNGTTWDRWYNNAEFTAFASAARTTTQTSADIIAYNADHLIVVLNMSNVGTGSVTLEIQGKNAVSNTYYPILTGAAITTNSQNRYRVGTDIPAVANSIAQDYLPRIIRIVVTANNANTATYSVGYNLGL